MPPQSITMLFPEADDQQQLAAFIVRGVRADGARGLDAHRAGEERRDGVALPVRAEPVQPPQAVRR